MPKSGQASSCDTPLAVSLVRPAELDAACLARWEELRTGNPLYRSPFFAPEFTLAVGQVRADARVAIVERGGVIVGFLPFHLVRNKIAKPIGAQINDYHGAILGAGLNLGNRELLLACGIHAYDFNHLPMALASGIGGVEAVESSPQMELSAGYDAATAGMGGSWKRGSSDMRRKLRKMEREVGQLHFVFDDRSNAMAKAHAEMRTVLYREMRLNSVFGEGWEGDVIDLLRAGTGSGLSSVTSVLTADGEPVAMHFGLISRGVLHWWFPAYALRANRYSPGLGLIDYCAREANDHAVTLIDFGRGEERYKRLFANRRVALGSGSATCGGSSAAIVRGMKRAALKPIEHILPKAIRSYPRRISDKLITGVAIPR